MKGDVAKQVLKAYLEKVGKKIKIKKEATPGPDFIVEGEAYECKGSKFNEKRLFIQLLSYASQFSRINLVLPSDALTFKFIWKLEATEYYIRNDPVLGKTIGIFLIAEIQDGEYAICNYHYARSLDTEISSILYRLIPYFTKVNSVEEKEKKILEFLDTIEARVKEKLKELIIQKAREAKSIWEGAILHV